MKLIEYRESAEPDYPDIPVSTFSEVFEEISAGRPVRTLALGDYAILPMLPELAERTKEKRGVLSAEFSSADNVLDLKGTEALLKEHRLMVDDVGSAKLSELLR